MGKSNLLIILVGCFLFIDCLKEESAEVTITLAEIIRNDLGKKGTIAIYSSANPDFSFTDTSKSIKFQSKLKNQEKEYQVNCGFWKAGNEKDDSLYTFCNYDETIPAGNYNLDISGVSPISIPGYTITLKTYGTLDFTKSDEDIVDIYSGKQTINVEEGKDNYELRFKISSYNNEPIMISNKESTTFIDCSKQNEELVCKVTKNQIESILDSKEKKISVGALDYHMNGGSFILIPGIAVNYNLPKTDVFVRITKLLENVADEGTLIAYETNVTDITNVLGSFSAFTLEFTNSKSGKNNNGCSFRKYSGFPLLLLCWAYGEGTNVLNEITEEKIFDNINIKYNFRIQPVKNEEKIEVKRVQSSFIYYNYPYILDFTKSDSLSVNYHIEEFDHLTGLTFNENKGDLTCQIIKRKITKCTVPKSHFDGKETGYYFLKHTNYLYGKSTSYEGVPVKVILDGSGFNKVSFTLIYSLLLILIMF